MNCGGAPMSSCRPLKIVTTSSPSNFKAFCIRFVYTGLAPIHSSIAICSISGTRTASCSRERSAYLLVMNVPADVHLDGVVDVGSPCFGRVTALALILGLLAFGQHPFKGAVN